MATSNFREKIFEIAFKRYYYKIRHISGTPALTTRGLKEADIDNVVDFIDKGLKLAKEISAVSGPKIIDFKKAIHENAEFVEKVSKLRGEVEKFSEQFVLPGYSEY